MKRLYLKGYLHIYDYDKEWRLEDGQRYDLSNKSCDLLDKLYEFAIENSFCIGLDILIPNCNLRIYATNNKSTLDEAQTYLLGVFDGLIESDLYYWGYSEYTVVGFSVDSFTIGGHDLKKELKQYVGKYVHFVLETE